MKNVSGNNYFKAIIGPVPRERLDREYPNGEGALRWVLQDQFRKMFPDIKIMCSSGWGVTEADREAMSYATCSDEERHALIHSYYTEGKPMPRGLRCWELLYQEEDKKKNKLVDKKFDKPIKKRRIALV